MSAARFANFKAGLALFLMLAGGCAAPSARLTFPRRPIGRSSQGWFYNVHHRHGAQPDFALLSGSDGRIESVAYDDAGNGHYNRIYRLDDYPDQAVPHLIVLLDSIPYQAVADRYAAGEFRFFDPPQKVIPPFPSLTEICYSRLLGAPPLGGFVDDYYDLDAGASSATMWQRLLSGYREPWERRLHYAASSYHAGLAYLNPREWFEAELAIAKQTLDRSPDRVTLVYFISASSMLSKYGKAGLDEVLDGVQQLCTQLLYERQGALKITLLADHGHNLVATKNISLAGPLAKAGFHVAEQLRNHNDVVLELHGLVTYVGVRTTQPAAVARALCACLQVQWATYMDGKRVILCDTDGLAAIDCRDYKLRYTTLTHDVLRYGPVVDALTKTGKGSTGGFFGDADWFSMTLDHEYPDAPRRLWDAFHGTVIHPPEVMVAIRDGYCAGRPEFERFITMASTHGSLNQVNSATFVMSMTGRAKHPLRTGEVMATIEPGYVPPVR